jgi:UDP-N-acetylmuramoyl-L-alanyl-D-glutamate--2,6-diaminopimelate ligase
VQLPLPGRFNVTNAMIAAECVVALGYDPAVVAQALAVVTPPPGRFEFVDHGQPFAVIVDYAHTPEAIENVLVTARELLAPDGRLIVVIGAGGDRDWSKRPQMGQVASDRADLLFITSDNPRSEDPSAIIAAVASGCRATEPVLIEDRREAIFEAVASARSGDVVVLAGKGHEVTQVVGDESLPFDDREVVVRAIDERRPGGDWS